MNVFEFWVWMWYADKPSSRSSHSVKVRKVHQRARSRRAFRKLMRLCVLLLTKGNGLRTQLCVFGVSVKVGWCLEGCWVGSLF